MYLLAHKGFCSDSYVALNNLPQWRTVFSLIENGSGVVSLKIFNGYVDQNKKTPECVHFRCGLLHFEDSSKNFGKSYELQESFRRKGLEHD